MSGQIQYKSEKLSQKAAIYQNDTGSEVVLKGGWNVCYNQDFGVAATNTPERAMRVEKPSATNINHYAGVISPGDSGKVVPDGGTVGITILHPAKRGQRIDVFTEENCTLDTTLLTLVAGSFVAGGLGEGVVIAKAMQTADRSSTNGVIQALLVGADENAALENVETAAGDGPSPLIWDQSGWGTLVNNPGQGITYFEDYLGEIDVTTADGWTITAVTTGSIIGDVTEQGGVLIFDSAGNTTADDGVQAQLGNCMFLPVAGVKIFFEARVKMNDATDQYYIGLAGIDATLIAAGVIDDVVDKCGFYHAVAGADDKISTVISRTTVEEITHDVAANVDNTYVKLGFVIDGLTSIKFYVNGVLVETSTTTASIPNAVMALSFVSQIEVAGADAELSVDWVRIAQIGGRA